ncbi:SGNH/GDSL hydrolase family protein [Novosphingobium beihaiensis]|uniref:SGNH/GDSL hydrolase family protein n=1 Tax=Novosphingobium beihaiensis TaxID=2930389 RepID=A0ABT0BLG6_9SPHN|nr:SGNH/GDSL hydrolase family protein [Novosphingobium beihaiensis]MCJ2185884.1 SGNH/GDSL hydrolase family protein [Novosphingobium beihaiensis]
MFKKAYRTAASLTKPGLIAMFTASTLASCAGTAPVPSAKLPITGQYVAMGSSYAAGPMLGSPKPGTPSRCGRDNNNYATLLAARMGLDLIDVSCSGATTAHILGPWKELPAQLDALTPDTRLVTVTIGGNDVNYVRNVYVASCNPAGHKCPPLLLPTEADWQNLEAHLTAIGREVHARSPKATLVFVEYVTLVPDGKVCAAVPLSDTKAATMREQGKRLAAVTAQAAKETGALLIDTSALSAHHTPCDADPWSMGAPNTGPGAPWHPSAAGMRSIADALVRKLQG